MPNREAIKQMLNPYVHKKLEDREAKGEQIWPQDERFTKEMKTLREIIEERCEKGELIGSELGAAVIAIENYLKKQSPEIKIENLSFEQIDKIKFEEENKERASFYSAKSIAVAGEALREYRKKLH